MGAGFHGGFGRTKGGRQHSSIVSNANTMKQQYPLTRSGYFGSKGKNCRIITSASPESTSIDFYRKLGKGGTTELLRNGKGTMTILGDGTRIVHRIVTKTKGSPAVQIFISGLSKVKDQKIHFVFKED